MSALTAQLAELRGSLAAARDGALAAETAAARLQEDRVRLSKVGRFCVGANMHPSLGSHLKLIGKLQRLQNGITARSSLRNYMHKH